MKRRDFLARSGGAVSGSWISMSLPAMLASSLVSKAAKAQGKAFRVLTESEAKEFEAIAARIIPSGETPGAVEAGVIHFIDTVLADDPSASMELMRAGLRELQAEMGDSYGIYSFAALDDGQQIQVLQGIEDTAFFQTIRLLTIGGMFANPSYGGNRDRIGWNLVGFEGPQASQPPFGYYDADYMEKGV